MIQAITNQQVGLNVITELIIGYALPGRPVAMMMFKTWGYITMAQGAAVVFLDHDRFFEPFRRVDVHLRFQTWPLHEDSSEVMPP